MPLSSTRLSFRGSQPHTQTGGERVISPAGLPSLARWSRFRTPDPFLPIIFRIILVLITVILSPRLFFCFRFRTRALEPCLRRTRVSSRLFHSSSLGQGLCPTPGPLAEAPCLPVLMLQSRGYRCSTSLLGSTHLSSQDFLLLQC